MNPTIRILILAALAAFLISGLLEQQESESISMDTLFTLAFLGYIWHMLRRHKERDKDQSPAPTPVNSPSEKVPYAHPFPPPRPHILPQAIKLTTSSRIIQHKHPWTIVEQGKSVGYFRHLPIPAWIRTSDNRQADYAGIAQVQPPEECVCLELPDRAELIVPPGLIYAIRS